MRVEVGDVETGEKKFKLEPGDIEVPANLDDFFPNNE